MQTEHSSPPGVKAAFVFAGTTAALGVAVAYLWFENPDGDPGALRELALESDEVREAAMRELVARGEGVWDSFSDPDVGRVLQRNVEEREFRGVKVSSNAFGMRERDYQLEKPEGLTRVALLGDSFVFGYKAEAEDRLGVFLESYLEKKAGGSPKIECLHLGISSWNIQAECAYMRRQLHVLQPDLVVQVVVVNDLDDLQGVRGFGAMGGYSPQFRERANGTFTMMSPAALWPRRVQNFLLDALDYISRERYARAAEDIAQLAAAVEAAGGRYVLMIAWDSFNPMARKYLAPELGEDQLAFVSRTFTEDLRFRIGRNDRHWNRAGHERMAQLLYGLIQERELLPELKLQAWDPASRVVREVHHRGVAEASFVERYEDMLKKRAREQIQSSVDIPRLKQRNAKQVYGGVDADGNVAPFAAMILANPSAEKLTIRGTRFPNGLLKEATTRVFVDEFEVGAISLVGETSVDASFEVPAGIAGREFVSVRFVSSDYLLVDVSRGSAAAFQLERVELR